MARKNESVLNLLVQCPWWVSVLVSGIAFVFLRFVLPSIEFQNMLANSFAKGLSRVAPFVSLVLLIPAPIAALISFLKKRSHRLWGQACKIAIWIRVGHVPCSY